ncbi:MAG TPA: polysaccharide biosynthesis protein [Deltaproteobacteria bacterium]|nr:MAG: polysaccharide biosynthesis protein [Deltaproteobacteria bacterium GWA2_55_82]OGQ64609.1 MAG: polysaccharide biosynthesis protein [Deltaproteobacteria bacterium RIFCSPLOWO2_02_FULL_55_12]OIJ73707.1 MAG: polysaccharide biosynthesis protein [Deltaproteobacteria bacterium GWC2_55_46]HBG45899.1 polysaccharide biosynthesis protein [Deltaproteobacteria bacterium]HCY09682.1 polysaccharide biosynthesis protein [Deltaproteobacteria bacterium]
MSRIDQAIEKAARLREQRSPEKAHKEPPAGRPVAETPSTPARVVDVSCVSPFIVALNDQGSAVAEEYRKLKSIIVGLTTGAEEFRNTILVTSSIGSEGKSITSLNLAVTLSRDYDFTVLLIDTDLRRPSLNKYLNLEGEPGITDCLLDGLDLSKALIRTNLGKLSFLPAGRKIDNPAELLSSQKMKDFIAGVKQRYPDRYVIIDAPPILPFAESLSLSASVDGVLFVVRERAASVKHVGEALNLLRGSNLLGIVYNGAETEMSQHYSYYNY